MQSASRVYQRVYQRDGLQDNMNEFRGLVEPRGVEPLTFALRTRRSPN